jgi:hypothetical protein
MSALATGETATIQHWVHETRNPLRAEMRHYASTITPAQFERIASLIGRTNAAEFMGNADIGVVRASIEKAWWQADDAGGNLLAVAVYEGGCIIDIVAFDIRKPNAWALRTGSATMLGAELLAECICNAGWPDANTTVPVVATPLEWLAAGGEAVCIIDGFTPQSLNELRNAPALSAAPPLANFLRDRLGKATRVPEIKAVYDEVKRAA